MRDFRQEEASDMWINSSRKSMINAAPRFGKISTAIKIMKKCGFNKILCSCPRKEVIESWKKDLIKWGFECEIEYVTHTSTKKYADWKGDLFILDEPHEMSVKELEVTKSIVDNNSTLLLDGTITQKTRNKLHEKLGTDVCYMYSIKKAVEEGILCDYNINIHLVKLDNSVRYIKNLTESRRFEQFIWVRNKSIEEKKFNYFIDLKLISLLQNSIAKKNYTKKLIKESKGQRILVFCGTTAVADDLEISVYHSKSKEKSIFESFCNGEGESLATIKMMESGITIKPISKGILNYTSGNPEDTAQKICRFLGIEYDSLDKKADINIICSNTEFEKSRIEKALMFFDESKIKYIEV